MLFSEKTRNISFKVFAALSCLAAIYHFIGVFYKVDESPIWRHLLFVVINLFCAYGILKRPKYFVYLVGLLLVQQYYSHGTYMVNLWIEKKQVHWISVFDLLLLPIALFCLIEDCKMKNRGKQDQDQWQPGG
jgi:uncharacterized membrane protein